VSQNRVIRHVVVYNHNQLRKTRISINHLKIGKMKTNNRELTQDIFNDFALTVEEMIYVRGGECDPIVKTTIPPVKI
jgi:hypothetical protein